MQGVWQCGEVRHRVAINARQKGAITFSRAYGEIGHLLMLHSGRADVFIVRSSDITCLAIKHNRRTEIRKLA